MHRRHRHGRRKRRLSFSVRAPCARRVRVALITAWRRRAATIATSASAASQPARRLGGAVRQLQPESLSSEVAPGPPPPEALAPLVAVAAPVPPPPAPLCTGVSALKAGPIVQPGLPAGSYLYAP